MILFIRERHAKTLEIAQEEVLTCLGICVADRLHRVHRRLREEETVCRVFAAVAVDTLSRNFEMAVELKQGISQLELLYEELTREEMVKQQRREKLRLKRKKKKERKYANIEEKENDCECLEKQGNCESSCICVNTKPITHNNDRHKLQILDPKNKGQPTCECPDCQKKININGNVTKIKPKNQSIVAGFRSKKSLIKESTIIEQNKDKNYIENKLNDKSLKSPDEDAHDTCPCCEDFVEKRADGRWYLREGAKTPPQEEMLKWRDFSKRYEVKAREFTNRAVSEPLSQDCGYSSENISSSSIPSTPEGSEVACSEGCCSHEGECPDNRLPDKYHHHSMFSLSLLGERGPTLSQMLEVCYRFCSSSAIVFYLY